MLTVLICVRSHPTSRLDSFPMEECLVQCRVCHAPFPIAYIICKLTNMLVTDLAFNEMAFLARKDFEDTRHRPEKDADLKRGSKDLREESEFFDHAKQRRDRTADTSPDKHEAHPESGGHIVSASKEAAPNVLTDTGVSGSARGIQTEPPSDPLARHWDIDDRAEAENEAIRYMDKSVMVSPWSTSHRDAQHNAGVRATIPSIHPPRDTTTQSEAQHKLESNVGVGHPGGKQQPEVLSRHITDTLPESYPQKSFNPGSAGDQLSTTMGLEETFEDHKYNWPALDGLCYRGSSGGYNSLGLTAPHSRDFRRVPPLFLSMDPLQMPRHMSSSIRPSRTMSSLAEVSREVLDSQLPGQPWGHHDTHAPIDDPVEARCQRDVERRLAQPNVVDEGPNDLGEPMRGFIEMIEAEVLGGQMGSSNWPESGTFGTDMAHEGIHLTDIGVDAAEPGMGYCNGERPADAFAHRSQPYPRQRAQRGHGHLPTLDEGIMAYFWRPNHLF